MSCFPFLGLVSYLAVASVTGWYALADGSGSDIVDTPSIQSAGSFTIPSAWNGRRVRVSGQAGNTSGALYMLKGGSSFMGAGRTEVTNISGALDDAGIWSAPITVATGEVFTFVGRGTDANRSWGCVELLQNGNDCALVKRSSTFSVGSTASAIEWNDEEYDDNGFHDNSTNPSRISIPANGLYRFTASVEVAASGGEILIELRINGTRASYTCPRFDTVGNYANLISPPISLTTSDYVEVWISTTSTTTVSATNNSWFAVETLDSALQYAIAGRSSSGAGLSASTNTNIAMNTEVVDVGGWYTASNAYFTIPSGVTTARFGCQGQKGASSSGLWTLWVQKNGTGLFPGAPRSAAENANNDHPNAMSGPIVVSASEQFDFYARTNAGAQSASAGTSFWVEECPDYS